MTSVCRRRSVGSKCAPKTSVNSVRSVREKPSQRERKNSPATCMSLILSRGCVLFLIEEHRRTEHTGFHRDIKSTDFTERYSQHPSPNTLLLLIINTQQPSPNTHQPIRQTHYSKLARLAFVKINDNLRRSRAQDDVRTTHM